MMTPEETPAPLLSEEEQNVLMLVIGHIIPEDAANNLPGANDPAIFLDILVVDRQQRNALKQLTAAVTSYLPKPVFSISKDKLFEALAAFREEKPTDAQYLQTITALAYYRDKRVLKSIGIDPRPPFPEGYKVEAGDWDLLEPVRQRGKIYVQPDQAPLNNSSSQEKLGQQ